MALRGRSVGVLGRAFVAHLNRALSSTVTQAPLTILLERDQANIRFRSPSGSTSIPVKTRYGPMGLYIGQVCDFVQLNSGEYAIRTLQYRYALTPENHTDAQIRWEFVRFPGEEATYCRNHLQGPIFLNLFTSDGKRVTLNEMHLPTGWVPVEEVLRFCIVDLGVQPLHPDWDAILRRSERETWPSFGTMTDY